jgi:hypothetical protein
VESNEEKDMAYLSKIMQGLLNEFFKCASDSKKEMKESYSRRENLILNVPLYAAKTSIDLMLH